MRTFFIGKYMKLATADQAESRVFTVVTAKSLNDVKIYREVFENLKGGESLPQVSKALKINADRHGGMSLVENLPSAFIQTERNRPILAVGPLSKEEMLTFYEAYSKIGEGV